MKNTILSILKQGVFLLDSYKKTLLCFCVLFFASVVSAGPISPEIVQGTVKITQSGFYSSIQASDKSIINYESFDIASYEDVQFIQPNSNSRVLNRINSGIPSNIDGHLTANGVVYFVNPAGVIFSKNAIVDVGSLITAAANISNQDFLNNIDRFTDISGEILNRGKLQAEDNISIIARYIHNVGDISASHTINMITVEHGDLLLGVDGSNIFLMLCEHSLSNLLEEEGIVSSDLIAASLQNTGKIQASEIILYAHEGTVSISGTVDSSMNLMNAVGGNIKILGKKILLQGAMINASGDQVGGSIFIGGNVFGNKPLPKAASNIIDKSTVMDVSANLQGNGGNVVIWAEENVQILGNIYSQGGMNGGHGGTIETSGKKYLEVSQSNIHLDALNGLGGTWIINGMRR